MLDLGHRHSILSSKPIQAPSRLSAPHTRLRGCPPEVYVALKRRHLSLILSLLSPENLEWRRELKDAIRELKKVVRASVLQKESHLADTLSKLQMLNPKHFWRVMRKYISPHVQRSPLLPYVLVFNGVRLSGPEMLDAWSARYRSLYTRNPVDTTYDYDSPERAIRLVKAEVNKGTSVVNANALLETNFTIEEVTEVINSMKTGKAHDKDNVCSEALKRTGKGFKWLVWSLWHRIFITERIPSS